MLHHPDLPNIVKGLHDAGLTIGFAESCTGGRLSADLTTVPGSSEVVVGSAVCYQLRTKEKILGIEDLNQFNVVSKRVVLEMARAARRVWEADIGVATTGYLSPYKLDGKPWDPSAYWAVVGPEFGDQTDVQWDRVEFPHDQARDINREVLVRAVMDALSIFAKRRG